MKKIIAAIIIVLFMASVGMAAEANKSVTKTASGVISAGPGILKQIIFATDGTNAITFALYDNASAASGTQPITTLTITTSSVDRVQTLPLDNIDFFNGLYADVTCSGTYGYTVVIKQ